MTGESVEQHARGSGVVSEEQGAELESWRAWHFITDSREKTPPNHERMDGSKLTALLCLFCRLLPWANPVLVLLVLLSQLHARCQSLSSVSDLPLSDRALLGNWCAYWRARSGVYLSRSRLAASGETMRRCGAGN